MVAPLVFFAPAITSEELYLQDKRRRKWDDDQRALAKLKAENFAYWTKRVSDMRREGLSIEQMAALTGVPEAWLIAHAPPFKAYNPFEN